MTSQQGATFGHRLRLNSWFLGIGKSDPIEEVSPSPHHSCGIYFRPTSDFSTMNINFSGRDLKLIICNGLFCATEDLCHQCELYYYYYYYVDRVVVRTAQTSYALRLLRSHGLGAPQLFDVTRVTLVAQLTYASPAWIGFTNCEDKARLQGVLKKLQRSGFLPHNFQTFIQICEAADAQLFSSIIHNDDHVLHQLLPPVKTHSHNLRKRAHDFVIPRCDDSLMRKNFIIRLISANSF